MKRNKTKGLIFILDLILSLLTVGLAAVLLLSLFAPVISPERSVAIAFAGLGFPFIYVLNIAMMLFWIIRWRWIAFIPMAVLLLGAGNVNKFLRLPLGRDHIEQKQSGRLKIISYNVAGFWKQGLPVNGSSMKEIKKFILEQNPDIFCIQEFTVSSSYPLEKFIEGLEAWPHHHIYYAVGNGSPDGFGLATFSKYPLLDDKQHIGFDQSNNSSQWSRAVIRKDTVTIFNNHLQTTQISQHDRQFLGHEVFADDNSKNKVKNIGRKLARNFRLRARQADSISVNVPTQGSVIVCGDFNDTAMSYVYSTMKGDLKDPYRTKGRGLVSTYQGFRGLLRIDYIFHSDNYKAAGYLVESIPWSDHNPVIVELDLKK